MAKRNQINIDVMVNGKMTKATVDANKLNKALKQTGKSAQSADRQVKGLAQASANGSKNFAKMAQGMTGGLVPAYAAFAAQVFALTAAFNFLKNAADLENLRKSQVTFAQSSGLAIKSVTNELEEASRGMMGFQEAAQAAAMGAAKGFSTSQLVQLTEGAAKASGALGRSFQDTFDRLLRGVSKAEPELLDELGITLRLEEATRRYGLQIGQNAKTLTAAQRSQAVFVETMRQLNATFGDQEVLTNPFLQLGKTFEKIAQDVTKKVLPAFVAIADTVNKNATAAAVAFGALALLVLTNIAGLGPATKSVVTGMASSFMGASKSIIGSFGSVGGAIGGKISEAAKNAVYEIEFAELELEEKLKGIGTPNMQGAAAKVGGKSKTVAKLIAGEEVSSKALGKLKADLKRVKKELKDTGEVSKGVFAGTTLEAVEELEAEIAKVGKTSLSTSEKVQKGFGKAAINSMRRLRTATRKTAAGMRMIGSGAKIAGRGIKFMTKVAGKIFFVAGVLGTVIKAFEKLAETPITVIDSFKSFLSGLIKGFQTALNLIITGINALLDNAMLRKIFGEAPQIAEVRFADGIDETLNKIEGSVLTALGTDRAKLQAIEDATNERKEEEAHVENMRMKYQDLKQDIENITAGIVKQNNEMAKTSQITKGISTLPIQAAIEKAKADGNVQKVFDEVFKDIDMSAFGDSFQKAFEIAVETGDFTGLESLTYAATTYQGSLSAINDAATNLRETLSKGDAIGAQVMLQGLIDIAKAGDTAANVLGREGGLADVLDKAAGVDATALASGLGTIATAQATLATDKRNNALAQIRNQNAPGVVGQQAGLALQAEAANQAVREKQLALAQYVLSHQNLTEEEQKAYDIEVANRQHEIDLLNEKANVAKENATEIGQIGDALGESLSSGLTSAFQGIVDGSMTAKEAFAQMAQGMLQAIAKVITELLVAKLLTSALGGTGFGDFLGIPAPAKRYGGVMGANGKEAPGYAVGGVARGPQSGYPVMLHGTEAIVPLPNGKSIPVDMKGSAGQQNNITVNVSMDNSGQGSTDVQGDSQGMDIGKAIAGAVQKELQNQKRAGGMLSPYGVA